MAGIMKHVGKYGEKKCVVVFREVPDEPENCLIVLSDSLPELEHNDFMEVIGSLEAQGTGDVSNVLNRRQFTNGENMLNYLHFNKKITKVPVGLVSLTPTATDVIPLADVNAELRKLENDPVPPKTDPAHLAEGQARAVRTEVGGAEGLILQADLMEADAKAMIAEAEAKRAQAYELDPSLKPKRGPGRPPKTAN
jgi:hypothetical protein